MPQTITDVLNRLEAIQTLCADGDGLKWFNGLYLQMTQAVSSETGAGGFQDAAWLAQLDVQFARLYLIALHSWLVGDSTPECWRVLFENRSRTSLARIQCALAGVNAHINHDLAAAIVDTCKAAGTRPARGTPRYADYTAVNATVEALIDASRKTLHVRLPGDLLPAVNTLEDTLAAWNMSAARELAWQNAEHLWHLRSTPALEAGFLDVLDGFSTVIGKTLMVPLP